MLLPLRWKKTVVALMPRSRLLVPSAGASISTLFSNVAVTETFCDAVNRQTAPEQPTPLHDVSRAPLSGVAPRSTGLPCPTGALQAAPGQSRPGPPVTLPGPITFTVTETI